MQRSLCAGAVAAESVIESAAGAVSSDGVGYQSRTRLQGGERCGGGRRQLSTTWPAPSCRSRCAALRCSAPRNWGRNGAKPVSSTTALAAWHKVPAGPCIQPAFHFETDKYPCTPPSRVSILRLTPTFTQKTSAAASLKADQTWNDQNTFEPSSSFAGLAGSVH